MLQRQPYWQCAIRSPWRGAGDSQPIITWRDGEERLPRLREPCWGCPLDTGDHHTLVCTCVPIHSETSPSSLVIQREQLLVTNALIVKGPDKHTEAFHRMTGLQQLTLPVGSEFSSWRLSTPLWKGESTSVPAARVPSTHRCQFCSRKEGLCHKHFSTVPTVTVPSTPHCTHKCLSQGQRLRRTGPDLGWGYLNWVYH